MAAPVGAAAAPVAGAKGSMLRRGGTAVAMAAAAASVQAQGSRAVRAAKGLAADLVTTAANRAAAARGSAPVGPAEAAAAAAVAGAAAGGAAWRARTWYTRRICALKWASGRLPPIGVPAQPSGRGHLQSLWRCPKPRLRASIRGGAGELWLSQHGVSLPILQAAARTPPPRVGFLGAGEVVPEATIVRLVRRAELESGLHLDSCAAVSGHASARAGVGRHWYLACGVVVGVREVGPSAVVVGLPLTASMRVRLEEEGRRVRHGSRTPGRYTRAAATVTKENKPTTARQFCKSGENTGIRREVKRNDP